MPTFEEVLDGFFYRDDEPGLPGLQWLSDGQKAPVANDEQPREYLAFALRDETYAMGIELVREIVKVPPLTEVPRGPKELLGVMNLRGEVLPVYDVRARLMLQEAVQSVNGPADVSAQSRIVLVRSDDGDAGILVDGVEGVVRLMPSHIEPAPLGGTERPFLIGISRKAERLFIILDVEQALAT
jgi:purine-binding chemotaxis protein CheW